MANKKTSLYAAVDALLEAKSGLSLHDWLANEVRYRQTLHPKGQADYRRIAAELTKTLDQDDLTLSHETVRQWWRGLQAEVRA